MSALPLPPTTTLTFILSERRILRSLLRCEHGKHLRLHALTCNFEFDLRGRTSLGRLTYLRLVESARCIPARVAIRLQSLAQRRGALFVPGGDLPDLLPLRIG